MTLLFLVPTSLQRPATSCKPDLQHYVKPCNLFNESDCFAGSAYVHGLKSATGDFVIIMDADLSHHVRLCAISV